MQKGLILTLVGLAIVSCSKQAPSPSLPSQSRIQVLGVVEIRVVADPLQPISSAQFIPSSNKFNGQTTTPLDLTLARVDTTVLDQQDVNVSPKLRYVSSSYKITNNSASDWPNLYFVALSDSAATPPSVGQTALHSLLAASGASLDATPSIAQNMRPTHSMTRGVNDTLQVDNNYADLELFTEAKVVSIQAQTSFNGVSTFLLPYGFSARNLSAGRLIEKLPCSNTGCNQGLVSFAYRFPRTAPSASLTPYAYTIRYQAIVDTEGRISQSAEETTSNLNTRKSALIPTPTVVAVNTSSTYSGTDREDVGKVRISGNNPLIPITTLFP